jgi:molybdate transport system substrate-binding protein
MLLFAAASTRDVVAELLGQYRARGGGPVRASFAASSTLAKQIAQGAPAALYLSAHPRWVDYLQQRGHLVPQSRADWASTRLVVIAPKGKGFGWRPDRPLAPAFAGRLAVGDPDHVPVGIYARQALSKLGWWKALAPRVVPAADTRAALAFVERGACAAGVVYEVDARRSARVTVVARLPAGAHDPITYQLVRVRGRGDADGPRRLQRFLLGPQARTTLARHGFAAGGRR